MRRRTAAVVVANAAIEALDEVQPSFTRKHIRLHVALCLLYIGNFRGRYAVVRMRTERAGPTLPSPIQRCGETQPDKQDSAKGLRIKG